MSFIEFWKHLEKKKKKKTANNHTLVKQEKAPHKIQPGKKPNSWT